MIEAIVMIAALAPFAIFLIFVKPTNKPGKGRE